MGNIFSSAILNLLNVPLSKPGYENLPYVIVIIVVMVNQFSIFHNFKINSARSDIPDECF